jgi:predicted CXXCH cytochrome family protein
MLLPVAAHGGPARTPPRFVGEPELDFSLPHPPAPVMPSGVAVDGGGNVFLCDGANERVLHFEASGAFGGEIRVVAGKRLLRPMSVHFDSDGHLWIADAGCGCVYVCQSDGENGQVLSPVIETRTTQLDLTDAVPAENGQAVWCVDNDGHSVLRVDVATGQAVRFGQRGAAAGQLDYPFMLAITRNGDVLVTDVLNGRVAVFDAAGRWVRSLGSYGVSPGQFYHPKGIAIDAGGQVWVSDAVLGVVQVFGADGGFLGVLRTSDGRPFRFDEPAGLAFDSAGQLYVVESAAGRVRRIRVRTDLGAPAEPPPPVTLVSPQPRECTACHLEWMWPLIEGRGTELIDVPDNPPEHPAVSRAAACRRCHDGTVADSRRRVWVEHGHQEGLALPADMPKPPHLPFPDGRLACRTCHSAHTRGGSGNALKDAVFLRVERDPGELCAACHPGLEAGTAAGMHPMGSPTSATSGSAPRRDAGEQPDVVTCLGCHVAHGPRQTHLLTSNPHTNEGCLTCHADLSAAGTPKGKHAHTGEPLLAPAQRAVVSKWGTASGLRGELLCRTCHRAHHAPFPEHLLAFDPTSDACAGCHPAQNTVTGTPHDLRRLRNAVAATGGNPCGGCHRAHGDARPARPTEWDPHGQCSACHGAGDMPTARGLGPANHSQAECTACHDPHGAQYAHFMRARPEQVCLQCHAASGRLADGPHDLRRAPDRWPSASVATQDLCLSCHRPHGMDAPHLWRAQPAVGAELPDAICLACHRDATPGTDSAKALIHPQARRPGDILPAATTSAAVEHLYCGTCHDPHQSAPALWRLANGQEPQQLCLRCHEAAANIDMIGHGAAFLAAAGFRAETCQPCHRVHGNRAAVDGTGLWSRDLCEAAASSPERGRNDDRCRCCHRDGGPAPLPPAAAHPTVEMYNPERPGTPNHLPLFHGEDVVDPRGEVRCQTCHLTHGRPEPLPLPEGLEVRSARELRARRWHIRPFVAPNVCTTCHGADALRRFMYFHDPVRRAGAVDGGPATRPGAAASDNRLAQEAHRRGLAIGSKNDPAQAAAPKPFFDFAVSESCFAGGWCEAWQRFPRGQTGARHRVHGHV